MLVERESCGCSFHATKDFSRTFDGLRPLAHHAAHYFRALFRRRAYIQCNVNHAASRCGTMEQSRIDEIARRLLGKVPEAARNIQADLEENFRAVLRASLSRLDLVSRDEFAVQSKVLERTRARLRGVGAA